MKNGRLLVRLLAIAALLGGGWAGLGAAAGREGGQAKEEKKEAKKEETIDPFISMKRL